MSESGKVSKSVRLSANFTLAELTRSDVADRIGDDNMPTAAELDRIKRFLVPGLEQARTIIGGWAIHITSGFRNDRVNRAAGGVVNSAHRLGYAADFHVPGLATRTIAAMLAHSNLIFDQLIWETSRGVVHLSFDPRSRRQVLTQAGGPGSPVAKGLVG